MRLSPFRALFRPFSPLFARKMRLSPFRILQLLPNSQDATRHACDGSQDRGPRLGTGGTVRVDTNRELGVG